MKKNIPWLLYWKWRQYEMNSDSVVNVEMKTNSNLEWTFFATLNGSFLNNSLRFEAYFVNQFGGYVDCKTKDGVLFGQSSNQRVIEIIQAFRENSEHCADLNHVVSLLNLSDDSFEYLVRWRHLYYDEELNFSPEILIESNQSLSWKVRIALAKTPLVNSFMMPINKKCSDLDWIQCEIKDGMFYGEAGPLNLLEVLDVFRDFSESNSIDK